MDIYERQSLEREKNSAAKHSFQETVQRDDSDQFSQSQSSPETKKNKKPGMKDFLTAWTKADFGRDGGFFVTIGISVIADFFGLIPYLGAFLGIFFSIILWTLYFMMGQLENRLAAKATIASICSALETLGGIFLISFLPMFTFSSGMIYWLELSQRKANESLRK